MKQVSREKLRKTLCKEYRSAHNWCKQGFGRYYVMNINVETGDTWADVFLDENSQKIYNGDEVHSLYTRGDMLTFDEKVDDYLSDACKHLKKAGWEII